MTNTTPCYKPFNFIEFNWNTGKWDYYRDCFFNSAHAEDWLKHQKLWLDEEYGKSNNIYLMSRHD